MASNSASPFGIEFGHVEDLHGASGGPGLRLGAAQARGANDATQSSPRSGFSRFARGVEGPRESPFAALSSRHGRPLRIGILSDFIRIPYANGAAFQTRFLYQELRRCGHEVTVIGPHDPEASPDELAPGSVSVPSVPLKTYPGVNIPLPLEKWVFDADRFQFDLLYAPVTSLFLEFGLWLRKMRGIPLLAVHTTHLAAAYDVLLPEKISKIEAVHAGLRFFLTRPHERVFANVYNEADGLIVLSDGLRNYWRERGVTVPIHVVPRTVQPEIFDKPLGPDPYTHLSPALARGSRLLCAGRHTREKAQDRVIRIFARHVAPHDPECTLTMLGEGPDSAYYRQVAREEGVEDRVFFPGEVSFTQMTDYYAYADVFVHASLSETFGNVLGEALWCGTPTVAFADGMGVSSQIRDGVNGVALSPGADDASAREADRAFGRSILRLLDDPQERARIGKAASRIARERSSPRAVQEKLAFTFQHAQEHAAACGLRPAVEGPKPLQWLTTFRHFKSWAAINAGVYVAGHLRPGAAPAKKKSNLHPQIAE